MKYSAVLSAACVLLGWATMAQGQTATQIEQGFPRFSIEGHEKEAGLLNQMHRLHYPPIWLGYPSGDPQAPLCTLWDEWLTGPCLWAADDSIKVCDGKATVPQRMRASFVNKVIDDEGYVSTHQHVGIAHQLGWPFPYWMGSPGAGGAHFSAKDTASPVLPGGVPVVAAVPTDWTLEGVSSRGINEDGWQLHVDAARASIMPGKGAGDPFQSPFMQIRWRAKGLEDAQPYIEWETQERPGFTPDRRMYFPPPGKVSGYSSDGMTYEMLPLYRHPGWKGTITRTRVCFGNAQAGADVILQALFTQYDTRHNINNFDFIRGCIDFFLWTGDVDFLRQELPRIRKAMRFAQSEFKTRENNCVLTPWVGHEGRTGVVRTADGKKTLSYGNGIGSNYWDILPWGYKDCYATIRYYDTLIRLAGLERQVGRHPEWNLPGGEARFDPDDLEKHAAAVKEESNRIFWSEATGRFVAGPDIDGKTHDYGFTFVNTDAIYYGLASDEHARKILDWLEGKRIVDGDTSTGADIYHFTFAPRCTTKRNLDYYFWGWSNPEGIPFEAQVQDGGCVFGWSYMDLMSRLKVDGADNAWGRLKEIVDWFGQTQAAGGYRAYYAKQGASLQGEGTAGGLGLDKEFVESLLVPQVMLRGFVGFYPTYEGCRIEPKLPKDWPSAAIENIHLRGMVMSVTVSGDQIVLKKTGGHCDGAFVVTTPKEFGGPAEVDWGKVSEVVLKRK